MSIINQMLQDLEKRRSRPLDEEKVLAGLEADRVVQHAPQSMRLLGWFGVGGLGLLIVLLLSLSSGMWEKTYTSPLAIPAAKPNSYPISTPMKLNPVFPALLRDVYVTGDAHQTALHIDLTQPNLYHLSSNPDHTILTVDIENAYLTEPIHLLGTMKTAVEQFNTQTTPDGDVLLQVKIMPGAEVSGAKFLQDNHSQLLIALQNHAPGKAIAAVNANAGFTPAPIATIKTAVSSAPSSQAPLVVKVAQPLTADQAASQTYEESALLAQQNRLPEAIASLQALLKKMPTFIPARRLLMNLLIQQQKYDEAEKVLQIGLKQQPGASAFILGLARIQISRAQYNVALTTLQSINPPLQGNSNYYGLMAGLYERLGQPQRAIDLYQQLLVQYPDKAVWWLGLGVCLEATGRSEEALAAYQRAGGSGALNPQLQEYVNNRIQKLAGTG
jgi:Flp pilus assembly protein TadD